ncbi:MAG: helix-turn-helix domain-containing protein [Treponema sp.]|nr:helix-turn-helix domain-containing protein [Treponema sp.]MCL2250600.1 helix-turn-helix domain-containing protein [Treponema sp.]
MTKKFSELRAKMSPERRARNDEAAKALLAEMPLAELRNARGLSQQMLADLLHIQQPAVAKLEKRTDMYISTLRSHIRAMGGDLDIIARFPDGDIRITNFAQI